MGRCGHRMTPRAPRWFPPPGGIGPRGASWVGPKRVKYRSRCGRERPLRLTLADRR